jgi:hypothetical protein
MNARLDGAGSPGHVDPSKLDLYVFTAPDAETQTAVRGSRAESAVLSKRRDEEWRRERVATAAYYLAANRGFEPGNEAADWSLAELQIDALDAGRKL